MNICNDKCDGIKAKAVQIKFLRSVVVQSPSSVMRKYDDIV